MRAAAAADVRSMLIAHLSDLHVRDAADVVWFERQLDRVAARSPDHLAITGDLLDRWSPPLLAGVLDALDERGLLHSERLTILHGNHDLASGGGHPRRGADLWRLVMRFWDPPPLLAWRRQRFYATVGRRAPGVAFPAPFAKPLASGARIATLDTVSLPWLPIRIDHGMLMVRHAVGRVRQAQAASLASQQPDAGPLIVLMHHYPLDTPPFQWSPEPGSWMRLRGVKVPMHIPEQDRARLWLAARAAGATLVLCGHVHRARLAHHEGIAVGLNGQSGAAWAGRTIAWYDLSESGVQMETETL